jgi:oxaloacetate decarboxylase alpha subunit
MKMELEVKSATDGTIHFLATAGSAITAGQPLAEIN